MHAHVGHELPKMNTTAKLCEVFRHILPQILKAVKTIDDSFKVQSRMSFLCGMTRSVSLKWLEIEATSSE